VKIAFAMLAHQHPAAVMRLVRSLTAAGHVVAIHFDLRSSAAEYRKLEDAFAGNASVRLIRKFGVRWGQWSIIDATLACLDEIAAAGWEPDYVYLVSGADYPIRAAAELESFLARNRGKEFIESVPANRVHWVRGGLQKERYQYRFFYNWRDQPTRFDIALRIQQRLGLRRKFVRGWEPHIGSQWWVLTWTTLRQILALAREPDVLKFFRTTLIPDELFFQTLVYHLVPDRYIVSRTLTLYQFTDYGVPVVYYEDHLDYLRRQPFFMARKISPHNPALFDQLDEVWHGKTPTRAVPDEAIGVINGEYEERRLTFRDGPPGLPIPGMVANKWAEDLGRINTPFFAVLGTSTVEMSPVARALSIYRPVLLHGQLFHPKLIEFTGGAKLFAGYEADDLAQRDISAPNFVADIVRAEKNRMSGFLLRWQQGWNVHQIMFERPNIRVALVKGDLIISFLESLLPTHPHQGQEIDTRALTLIEPEVLTARFEQFIAEFHDHWKALRDMVRRSSERKPSYIIEIDLARFPGSLQIENWLGLEPAWRERGPMWDEVKDDLKKLAELRAFALERLVAAGAGPRLLDQIEVEAG